MNKTPFYDSCYQQEDDNDILLQLLKAKISIDKSTGIRTIACDKDVFRQEDGCVIARDGDRLHMCLTMGEEVEVPDGVRSIALSAIHYPMQNKTIYLEREPERQVYHVEDVTEEWADDDLPF